MISMTIADIASVIGARTQGISPDEIITESAVIDSRLAKPGTFFIALPGESVDGNDFALSAIESGSRFAITNREVAGPCLVVEDTFMALQTLAHHARTLAKDCVFVGITGSQGKTTTKELLGHILATVAETVVPHGSFNNEIGLPLTILGCTDSTRFCVLEMGARHLGDIAALSKIAKPTIGTVLVVGNAHVGEFGSREMIAKAKGEMIDSLPPGGIAILGMYDEFTPRMGESRTDLIRITFGETSDCNVRAADIEIREGRAHFDVVTPSGRSAVSLRLIGAHQIANALAAAAVATALEVPIDSIASALSTAEITSKWRMELHDLGDFVVINDSYNANPESMRAALKTLALFAQESGGSSWAILGKMHELGESEAQSHQEIGRLVAELGIDHLVAVGTALYGAAGGNTTTHQCASHDEALELVKNSDFGDCFLIKASRAEALNVLAEQIVAWCSAKSEEVEE